VEQARTWQTIRKLFARMNQKITDSGTPPTSPHLKDLV
jgi:hypothetical protein